VSVDVDAKGRRGSIHGDPQHIFARRSRPQGSSSAFVVARTMHCEHVPAVTASTRRVDYRGP